MSARNNGRTLPRGPWSFSFVGTTVILFSWLAYCEGFEVRGVGTYRAASVQAGEVIGSRTQNFNFSITVKDCKWFLHFALANPFTDADYSELSYDGTNLYRITVFESWLNEEKKAGKHVGPNAAEAMVIDGEVPRFSYTHHGSIVWLAYASGCYFAKVRNGIALPPAFPGVSTARSVRPLNEFWQRVILEMHSENLFPSEVVYIETNAPGFN